MTNPKFVIAGLPPPGWMLAGWLCGVIFGEGPGRWAMLWPVAVYAFTCYAYACNGDLGAAALCKRHSTSGKVPWYTLLFFAPMLATSWTIWWFRHTFLHFRENPYDVVVPGTYLGRYPWDRTSKLWWWPSTFPGEEEEPAAAADGVGIAVVDMTAEFPARSALVAQARGRYCCQPTLDGDMPSDEARFVAMCAKVAKWNGEGIPCYVHCANGRGRSACVVALLLVMRGLAPDLAAAWRTIKAARPQCNVHKPQMDMLIRCEALWREGGGRAGEFEMTTMKPSASSSSSSSGAESRISVLSLQTPDQQTAV